MYPNNGNNDIETHFKCLKFPHEDANGNRMIACISVDISAQTAVERKLRRSNTELERLATTDTLTGLPLRRGFEKRIEAEFLRSAKTTQEPRPLSVLLIDVDNFKARNDTVGHAAGDQALRYMGQILLENARPLDIPARIGGDEFALLLPETESSDAKAIAERLLVGARLFGSDTVGFSISIGVASLDAEMKTWQELVEGADMALYKAKERGSNRMATMRDSGIRPSQTAESPLQLTH